MVGRRAVKTVTPLRASTAASFNPNPRGRSQTNTQPFLARPRQRQHPRSGKESLTPLYVRSRVRWPTLSWVAVHASFRARRERPAGTERGRGAHTIDLTSTARRVVNNPGSKRRRAVRPYGSRLARTALRRRPCAAPGSAHGLAHNLAFDVGPPARRRRKPGHPRRVQPSRRRRPLIPTSGTAPAISGLSSAIVTSPQQR